MGNRLVCTPRGSRQVFLLNRFFYPDLSPTSVLLSDLAFALSERGFAVTVITTRLRYDDRKAKLAPHQLDRGVDIRRVWSFRAGRDHLGERALEYLSFYFNAVFLLWRLARPGDLIVAKSDPPLLSIPASVIARLRGARLINWLQDLFPEVAERLAVGGAKARPIFRFLRHFRDRSLSAAALNVVPGVKMAQTLKRAGVVASKIEVIPNWSDEKLIGAVPHEENDLRRRWSLENSVVVAYVGNLGRAHDFDTILEAISLHRELMRLGADDVARDVLFLVVGGGAQREHLEREISRRDLQNVRLQSYQPPELLAQTLGAADIHLVSLKPEMEGLVVPSKFYGVAAAARPTIFIGSKQGEIGRLIQEVACGATVEQGDGAALLSEILKLARNPAGRKAMGARARLALESRWDKRHGLARWHAVIDRICPAAERPSNFEARADLA